jgi:hypothetical protein
VSAYTLDDLIRALRELDERTAAVKLRKPDAFGDLDASIAQWMPTMKASYGFQAALEALRLIVVAQCEATSAELKRVKKWPGHQLTESSARASAAALAQIAHTFFEPLERFNRSA